MPGAIFSSAAQAGGKTIREALGEPPSLTAERLVGITGAWRYLSAVLRQEWKDAAAELQTCAEAGRFRRLLRSVLDAADTLLESSRAIADAAEGAGERPPELDLAVASMRMEEPTLASLRAEAARLLDWLNTRPTLADPARLEEARRGPFLSGEQILTKLRAGEDV
jgi:hypothetical protein